MLDKIFPKQLDNQYKGLPLAKQAFCIIIIITFIRSLLHIFLPDGGAELIASIPLHTFTPASQRVIILIFAFWGLSQILMAIVYSVIYWRYQTFIPFMYILIFIEYSMRLLLTFIKPIATTHQAPGEIADWAVWPLSACLFYLAISNKKSQN